jgi:AcrR family transcriptional regulator
MQLLGTAGISLRGIARELNVTAPALYNYYSRLDDLITDLIVDAFNALADAMIGASEQDGDQRALSRIRAMAMAYRTWAVEHPTDFQLIYGNPIPGYSCPPELTAPLAAKPFLALMALLVEAWQRREIGIPTEYDPAPAATAGNLISRHPEIVALAPVELGCILVSSWARLHGLILLEMFGHQEPVTGDPNEYYRYELDAWLGHLAAAASEMEDWPDPSAGHH